MQAVMAALSWLAGCRDFFVDDVTEESSSRSSSKPNTKTRVRSSDVSVTYSLKAVHIIAHSTRASSPIDAFEKPSRNSVP